jgi:uncharacterized protein YndB with AHSA1/START domain
MTITNLIAKATTTIDAPRKKVWYALISPTAIKEYMFGADVITNWHEGNRIVWRGEWKGETYEDKGVVLQVKPHSLLQYSHFSPRSGEEDVEENYHTVTIELADGDGGTRVTLTQDKNATEEAAEHSRKNWEMMLQGLKKYVEGKP